MSYTYLWEFIVAPEHKAEFERHYGAAGAWVALFRQSPGYVGTLLLRDLANPLRFVTIDRWESERAYKAFRTAFASEYAGLDETCQHLTTCETALGSYFEAGD